MTVHSEHCDGWHFVGKGNLPNPDEDSVPCQGQCVPYWEAILSESAMVRDRYHGDAATGWDDYYDYEGGR